MHASHSIHIPPPPPFPSFLFIVACIRGVCSTHRCSPLPPPSSSSSANNTSPSYEMKGRGESTWGGGGLNSPLVPAAFAAAAAAGTTAAAAAAYQSDGRAPVAFNFPEAEFKDPDSDPFSLHCRRGWETRRIASLDPLKPLLRKSFTPEGEGKV